MAKADQNLAQLEMLVLLAVMRLQPADRHLSKIVITLEERTSRWISVANVFTSLVSMTKKGYLEGRQEQECRPGPGRKTKMFYKLTQLGEEALNLALRDITSMTKGVQLWALPDS
jgi:DNA-binding PadR family transcriptional regulator